MAPLQPTLDRNRDRNISVPQRRSNYCREHSYGKYQIRGEEVSPTFSEDWEREPAKSS